MAQVTQGKLHCISICSVAVVALHSSGHGYCGTASTGNTRKVRLEFGLLADLVKTYRDESAE